MNKLRSTIKVLAIAIFMFAFVSIAQAQATRTWVSGVGDDVNPCSRTAPCKTFAGAISKTAAGGEIDVLDPGGFGTVTITKSLTIDGTTGSGFGSILASGTVGVNVNDSGSGSPNTSIVRLRSLSIQGAGVTPGTIGINFTSGKNLYVENCLIQGFKSGTGHGISVNLTANASQTLTVTDSIISENLNDGIRLGNSGGAINAFIDNTRLEKNGANGLECTATSVANVRNSSFSFNTGAGLSMANAGSSANVEDSFFQGSPNHGIIATAGTVRLRGNHVTNNANGLTCSGGTISSYGDNAVQGNGTALNGCADPLPVLQKK